jgi:hypothetical protein
MHADTFAMTSIKQQTANSKQQTSNTKHHTSVIATAARAVGAYLPMRRRRWMRRSATDD